MIAYIGWFRTEEWKRDPNRRPALLPKMIDLRLQTIADPSTLPVKGKRVFETHCEKYAMHICDLLREVSNERADHRDFARLVSKVRQISQQDYRLEIALRIGESSAQDDDGVMSLHDLLKVELVADVLRAG